MVHKSEHKYQLHLYPKDIFQKLEFDKVQQILHENCRSTLGQDWVQRIRFFTQAEPLQVVLKQVVEFKSIVENPSFQFPEDNYLNLSEELSFLKIEGYALSQEQMFRLLKVLQTVSFIQYFFEENNGEYKETFAELYKLVQHWEISKELINAIKQVLDEDGKIRTNASPELARIRKAINHKFIDINNQFKHILSELRKNNWLTDEGESIRNGRRVLAVPSEVKRKINGIVVDESSTGKTTFIEPAETLQLNNELFELQQEEKREIYRILKELTAQVRPFAADIEGYQRTLGLLDFIRAKALLAQKINGIAPDLSRERVLELHHAYHPLLYLRNLQQKRPTIPLGLRLSLADRILLISGPNAGGKSVALKTVGLLQLMLQAGLLVPVSPVSQMCLFDSLLVDMGDEQSLENDLSTYSSRLTNMRHFVNFVNHKSLCLIDEFGSGTDPQFGGAIAEAILETLNEKHAYGVITTHYSNLKIFAAQTPGIINGAMAYNQEALEPLYRLETGQAGSSYAFEIAKKIGLPAALIQAAQQKLGDDYRQFDQLLTNMQRERNAILEKEAELSILLKNNKQLKADYEEKNKYLDKNTKKIILNTEKEMAEAQREAKRNLENMLRSWSEEEKRTKEEAEQIRQKLQASIKQHEAKAQELHEDVFTTDTYEQVEVGSQVRLRDSQHIGTVAEIEGETALVEMGNLKTRINLKELDLVAKKPTKPKVQVKYNALDASLNFEHTIDVRGLGVIDALREVDTLVDAALIANAHQLKIIHGYGNGILRKEIRKHLKSYHFVKKLSHEDPQYGGEGVTIVDLG
ncbi:MAG: Smr/MutS family protein [Chitinophagales bacterium]|nr:Smr/MutS family protein [Bacteroidota bacterium]MCB9042186.1 Smr/MutS family protein [Chitinophagales bacterium]